MAAIEPGKQYLGVQCRGCGKLAPMIEVEEGSKLGELAGEFDVECPFCGHKGTYPAEQLRMMAAHHKH